MRERPARRSLQKDSAEFLFSVPSHANTRDIARKRRLKAPFSHGWQACLLDRRRAHCRCSLGGPSRRCSPWGFLDAPSSRARRAGAHCPHPKLLARCAACARGWSSWLPLGACRRRPPTAATDTCALPSPRLRAHYPRPVPSWQASRASRGVDPGGRCARSSTCPRVATFATRARRGPAMALPCRPFSADCAAARLACLRRFLGSNSSSQGRFWVSPRRVFRAEPGPLAARCDRGVRPGVLPVV